MKPLMQALEQTAESVVQCSTCGNLDLSDPCHICSDPRREQNRICVVAGVADLWAIERTGVYKGQYHILGGVLSALDGIGPDDLNVQGLLARQQNAQTPFEEVIIALSATVDGQTTAHYLTDKITDISDAHITRLAHGVPIGGELDYLDEGTITTALKSRSQI